MPDGPHLTLAPAPATYVKRRRTAGWRKPDGAVCCTRNSRRSPTLWGNPFQVGGEAPGGGRIVDNDQAVDIYRAWLSGRPDLIERARVELAGRTLMCWCAVGRKCHVQDVLLPLVNEGRLP
jgi:hypothetical protein